MERPDRHIDLFDYLNKAGPIKEPVVRDIFIQVRLLTSRSKFWEPIF